MLYLLLHHYFILKTAVKSFVITDKKIYACSVLREIQTSSSRSYLQPGFNKNLVYVFNIRGGGGVGMMGGNDGGGGAGWARGQRNIPQRLGRNSMSGSQGSTMNNGGNGGGSSWSRGSAVQPAMQEVNGGRQQQQPQQQGGNWGRGQAPSLQPGGPSLQPLKRSDKGWKKTEAKDEVDAAKKATIALLNKLTAENFDKITGKVLELKFAGGTKVLREVIDQIFDKALSQHSFTDTYAKLSHSLVANSEMLQDQFIEVVLVEVDDTMALNDMKTLQGEPIEDSVLTSLTAVWCWRDGSSDPKGRERGDEENEKVIPFISEDECRIHAMKQTNFKRILLNKCQEEFEKEDIYADKIRLEDEEDTRAESEGKKLTKEEKALRDFLRKREKKELRTRRIGNTLFIGSLFKLELLRENILHQCIQGLFGDVDNPDVESIEALCKLLTSVGSTMDTKARKNTKKGAKTKEFMRVYFDNMSVFAKHVKLDKRTQFMCRDVIDARNNGWVQRRKTLKVQTIAEIHKEAEQEEREKERQARQGGGGGRNNNNNRGGGRNDRRGGNNNNNGRGDVRGNAPTQRVQQAKVQGNLRVNNNRSGNNQSSMRPGGAGMRPGGRSGGGGMRPGGRGDARGGQQNQQAQNGRRGNNNNNNRQQQQQQQQQQQRPSNNSRSNQSNTGQQGGSNKMSDADLKKTCSSIAREYLQCRDVTEVQALMNELPKDRRGVCFVEACIDMLLNAKSGDRTKVEDAVCVVFQRNIISSIEVAKGEY